MDELLVHIGYPKTGTTTLQEEIFVKLHELGKINYLGRTIKSSHTRTGRSKFNGIDWVTQIRKNFILNEPLKDSNSIIKANILNVISDEDLTFHGLFHHAQFGNFIDHNSFPQKLHALLGENVRVNIFITIRNQADLIFSSYVQKFRFVKSFFGEYSFEDFLKNSSNYLDRNVKEHLALYDFGNITERWEKSFDTRVNILFFEDFVHDKNNYIKKLLEILNVSELELSIFNMDRHYRKTDKSKETIKSGFWSLGPTGRTIKMLFKIKNFETYLEKRYHMRSSVYLNFERKLLMNFNKVGIPNISIAQKEMIMENFRESNKAFAENRGIDLNKMKKYGYL